MGSEKIIISLNSSQSLFPLLGLTFRDFVWKKSQMRKNIYGKV